MFIPKITMSAPYSLKWNLGLLNLQGKGQAHASLGKNAHFSSFHLLTSVFQPENSKIILKLLGSRYQKNGDTYVKIESSQVEIRPGNTKLRFENLFNGNKNLEDVANNVISQNVDQISKEVLPQVQKAISNSIVKAANQIFELAPEREFFP